MSFGANQYIFSAKIQIQLEWISVGLIVLGNFCIWHTKKAYITAFPNPLEGALDAINFKVCGVQALEYYNGILGKIGSTSKMSNKCQRNS